MINRILLFAFLVGGIISFWLYEPSFFYLFLLVAIALYEIWEGWQKKSFSNLVFLDFFLVLVFLYNAYYSYVWPLVYIMLSVVLAAILFHFIYHEINLLSRKEIFKFESAFLGLIILEIFIVLKFWPIDPKVKSFIIAAFFYLWENFIQAEQEKKLTKKEIKNYIIILSVLLFLIIITSRWFGF